MSKKAKETNKEDALFIKKLKRNFSQIREDRALSISEDAELVFRRAIEDTERFIKNLQREREALLDLAPDNTLSTVPTKDFNAEQFIKKDMEIAIKLRSENIGLDLLKERYVELFGNIEGE